MLSSNLAAFKRYWLSDLLLLSIFIFLLYFCWLGSYPVFTPDEGRYVEVAREMVATGDYITPKVNQVAFLDKPILYYWLQAAAISVLGVTEWAFRFFPAILGLVGCLVTYICGRVIFDRRTGVLSALILATTPLYFGAAHYANLDLEVAVFITCTLLFWITGAQRQGKTRFYYFLASFICAAFACLTKGLIGLVFPLLIIGSWTLLLNRWSLLKNGALILGPLLFFCLLLPWYFLAQQANPDFFHYFFVTQHVSRFLSTGEFNNKTPFWFYLPVILIAFIPWTIFLRVSLYQSLKRIFNRPTQEAPVLFLCLWAAIVFIFFSIPHSKIITYILPIFPPLALITGHYLSQHWGQVSKPTLRSHAIHFIILALSFDAGLIIWKMQSSFPQAFTPYLVVIGLIFMGSAIGAWYAIQRKKLSALFLVCFLCNTLFLLTLTMGAKYLPSNSAKPLIDYIKTIKQPADEVIAYYKYYYDVPLYLEQPIKVVANWQDKEFALRDNWRRELWLGLQGDKPNPLLITDEIFWRQFESEKRVFVFLNTNYFKQFQERAKQYFVLEQYQDILLLSNQPIISNKHP